jgi:hypothetical protein
MRGYGGVRSLPVTGRQRIQVVLTLRTGPAGTQFLRAL